MRDIAISLLVFGLLTTVFKHPVIGAYVWAWLSMMSPHKLAFGFAFDMPFAADHGRRHAARLPADAQALSRSR